MMMCDEPYLKLKKLQNSKNQKSEDKNSQSEELKKKSLRLHYQDSLDQTRPNRECFNMTFQSRILHLDSSFL